MVSLHARLRGACLALVAFATVSNGQYAPGGTGMTPAERALMWQFGTRRWNDNYFQRQLFAVESQGRNERFRNQQMLRQQYGAQTRAQADRQRIRETMSPGARGRFGMDTGRGAKSPREAENDDLDEGAKSDVLLVWDEIGAGFDAADARFVQSVAPKYSGGLVMLAIRVDGPAEIAGWKKDDILIGFNGFQTKTYSDLAYIIEQPNLPRDKPIKALLIRGKAIFSSQFVLGKPGQSVVPKSPEKDLAPPKLSSPPGSGPKGADPAQSGLKPPLAAKPQSPPAPDAASPAGEIERRTASGRRLTAPPTADEPTKSLVPKVAAAPVDAPTPPKKPVSAPIPTMTDEEKLTWDLLGVRCKPANQLADKRFSGGLKISEIKPDSAARKAHWEVNDVLVGIDDYQVKSLDDLVYVLGQPNRKTTAAVDYRVLRGKEVLNGKVDLPPTPQ